MNLGVVGSRDFPSDTLNREMWKLLDRAQAMGFDTVVSGGARGVDSRAENLGKGRGMAVISFRVLDRHDGWFGVEKWIWTPREGWDVWPVMRPRGDRPLAWSSFGQAAFCRNGLIVDNSDGVVALWDGSSRGTKDSIVRAEWAGNLLEVILP